MGAVNEQDDVLKEIRDRTRRIETRQMRTALAAGIDPSRKSRVVVADMLPPTCDVSGLDVSLGDLVSVLQDSGISGSVRVRFNNEVVMVVELPTQGETK